MPWIIAISTLGYSLRAEEMSTAAFSRLKTPAWAAGDAEPGYYRLYYEQLYGSYCHEYEIGWRIGR